MRMWICWYTIKIQPNTLVNFFLNLKIISNFLSFTLQQIFSKDYDIVTFAHTFYFNDQCHFCINSTNDQIGPKQKSNPNLIKNGSANPIDSDL